VDAVAAVHDAGFVHRDVKAENFVVDAARQRLKIIDFGFATRIDQFDARSIWSAGTRLYQSPECVRAIDRDAPFTACMATASDMWSLGILLIAMLTGEQPWTEASSADARYEQWRGNGERAPGGRQAGVRMPAPSRGGGRVTRAATLLPLAQTWEQRPMHGLSIASRPPFSDCWPACWPPTGASGPQ
jgi:serine/threonine protein kinase